MKGTNRILMSHGRRALATRVPGMLCAVACLAGCEEGPTEPDPQPQPQNRRPLAVGTIPAQTAAVDATITVDVAAYFNDPDGDALAYTASSSDPDVATASVSGSLLTIGGVAAGTAAVTTTATDPSGRTASQRFQVTVPSRPPVTIATLPDLEVQVGNPALIRLHAYFNDPDGDALTYSASTSDPGVATVSVSGAIVTVGGVARGTATVTGTATDPGGLSASQSFLVTVEHSPRVTVASVVAAPEGGVVRVEVSARPPPVSLITIAYSIGIDDDDTTPDADGADYAHGPNGTLQIDSAAVGATIEIQITDDEEIEPPREWFTVVLDAPASDAAYLLGSTASATAAIEEGVCDRTPQVRDGILAATPAGRCEDATASHLAGLEALNLAGPPRVSLAATHARATAFRTQGGSRGRPGFRSEYAMQAGAAVGGARTRITELRNGDFDGLTGLTELWLQYNDLERLDPGLFAELSDLRNLYLNHNRLGTLDRDAFSGLGRLQELGLAGNRLSGLPPGIFSAPSQLQGLGLDQNQLTALPSGILSGLTRLERLWISENRIAALNPGTFSGLAALKYLYAWGNRLTTLPPGVFSDLSALEGLWLSLNELTELPATAFSTLVNLRELHLDWNRLLELPDSVFLGLARLTGLSLTDNPGAPFQLRATLERTDSEDAAAPGPAHMVLRLGQGAPFDARIPVAVDRGRLSTDTVLLERGRSESAEFTVTQHAGGQDGTQLVAGPASPPPNYILGVEVVVADTVVLFTSSSDGAGDGSSTLAPSYEPDERLERVVEAVDHAFLEGDDRVIRDRDVLGAHFRTALGDVAVTDPPGLLEELAPVLDIDGIEAVSGGPHEVGGADELLVLSVRAQDVAHVLAEEAFDALPHLLRPFDLELLHPPAVFGVARARLEARD